MLREYIDRTARAAPWYESVSGIAVERRVITVRTTLDADGRDRRAASDICDSIQASDVADFTRGHSVAGRGGGRLRCPDRKR